MLRRFWAWWLHDDEEEAPALNPNLCTLVTLPVLGVVELPSFEATAPVLFIAAGPVLGIASVPSFAARPEC